jgi:hypothetical protein
VEIMSKPFFIEKTESALPLLIERAMCEKESLSISGDSWFFSTTSAWRVVSKEGLCFGWESTDVEIEVGSLEGVSIVAVKAIGMGNLDIQFELGNGKYIECFTAQHYEPWELKLPDNTIMVADGDAV